VSVWHLERLLGWRYVRAIRGHGRLRFGAAVASIGVAIGVAALVIVLSVMNGYAETINDRLLSVNAHLLIRRPYTEPFADHARLSAEIASDPHVRSVEPFAQAEGFVLYKPEGDNLRRSGLLVRAMRGEALRSSIQIDRYLITGDSQIEVERKPGVYGAVIGRHLADRLKAGVGDEIHVSTVPKQLLLGRVPPLRRYLVTGVFATGYYEFDANLAFVPLQALQRDLGWVGRVSGLRVRLIDPFAAEAAASSIRPAIEAEEAGLFVTSWIHEHGNLYVWIRMQKWFSVIALSLIVIVAAFNVLSVMTVSVIERRVDIGILKAMGCGPGRIARVFTLQGIALGATGTALGCALGGFLCWAQLTYRFIGLRGDVYMIDALPVKMVGSDFIIVAALALALCSLFTLLPSRDAGALSVVEALRTG
jgi:lipoprotein-releasing system permease protein